MSTVRRSLPLTADNWQAIDEIAQAYGEAMVPARGPNSDTPSWRTMIRKIAEGEYVILPAPEEGKLYAQVRPPRL